MTTVSDAFKHALRSIKAEIDIGPNCLRQAAVAAGHDSTGKAKELLGQTGLPQVPFDREIGVASTSGLQALLRRWGQQGG